MTKHAGSYLEHFPPERLVYLSSDSSELLTSLEAGTACGTNPNPTLTPTPTLTPSFTPSGAHSGRAPLRQRRRARQCLN